ncbi:MAG: carboxypeptidase-like regulatory domain-containing protein [Proteobacteria bacterium]|nr:carboxypeptidase-like regulatory domain-containing protein [Pseudomonadota bacterium]
MKKLAVFVSVVVIVLALSLFFWSRYQPGKGDPGHASQSAQTETSPTKKSAAEKQTSAEKEPIPSRGAPEVFRDDDPQGPLRLEGQVIDDSELAVGGAVVVLSSNPPQTTTTEEDGSFVFDRLVPRTYSLSARKENLVGGPVMHELTESSHPAVIRMSMGAAILATVVDEKSAPIAGADVELRDGEDTRSQTTDGDGKSKFGGVGSGFVWLIATAPGYGITRRPVQVPKKAGVSIEARIVMGKGVPVSGRVLDEEGKPVRGARVVARDASAVFSSTDIRRDGVLTNDRGQFALPALSAGIYRFRAVHSEYAPGSSDLITVDGTTGVEDVTIELSAGGSVAGKVVDQGGRVARFASVRVETTRSQFGGLGLGSSGVRQATCDEHGGFKIKGLPRAEVRLVAQSDEASSEAVTANLQQTPDRSGLVLELTISGTIAGVVVDSDGEPVAEAQITVLPDFWQGGPTDDFSLRGMAAEITDGGGRFALRGLPEGKYRVRASRGEVDFAQFIQPGVQATTGTEDLRLVLDRPGRVVGILALDDGSIPEAFTVAVGFPPGVPVANNTGAFEVDELPPGRYDVTFRGPSFAPHTVRDVMIAAGKDTDLGTIKAPRGRTVSGRVIDSGGHSIAGATVIAARQLFGDGRSMQAEIGTGMDELFGVKRVLSGSDGAYRMRGISRSEMQLIAEHTEKGRSLPSSIPVGASDLVYELTLRPFGSVHGTVFAGEQPASGMNVIASAKTGGNQMLLVQTGQDGSYIFERLPEGPHRITASLSSQGLGSSKSTGVDVEVVAGQRTQADIRVEVGDIEFEVEVAGKAGAHIDAAQVFLFKGQVNGDLNDTSFAVRLQENLEHLRVYCETKTVAASPAAQRHAAVVPPMDPLPQPQL